jgi:hypothetical protein
MSYTFKKTEFFLKESFIITTQTLIFADQLAEVPSCWVFKPLSILELDEKIRPRSSTG